MESTRARDGFRAAYERAPDVVVRSPGRVNLIGEHVDYVDGLVLPAAIDRGTLVAARRIAEPRVRARSHEIRGVLDCALSELRTATAGEPSFAPYVRGVLASIPRAASVSNGEGLELFFTSDLPIGSGLSSSASLELGVAVAAQALGWPAQAPVENARASQRAEHEFAGVKSGLMDQLAVACGRADHALLVDCRTLSVTPAAIPAAARLLVLDSASPRTLAGSAYNERRASCERAMALLGKSLRDVADGGESEHTRALTALQDRDPKLVTRVRHVLSEITRVRAFVAALASNDLVQAGAIMNASHESLRVDYEVSSAALDALVEEARKDSAVRGARLTGAGFGGCAIALVVGEVDAGAIMRRYHARTSLHGRAFIVKPSAGTHVV